MRSYAPTPQPWRPRRWPEAGRAQPAGPAPPPDAAPSAGPFGLALRTLCDEAAPELSLAFGLRLALRPDRGPNGFPEAVVAGSTVWRPAALLTRRTERYLLEVAPDLAAQILNRALGGPADQGPADAPGPQSAGWLAVCSLLGRAFATACGRCLRSREVTAGDPAGVPAADAGDPADRLVLAIFGEGVSGRLSLRAVAGPAEPGAPGPSPAGGAKAASAPPASAPAEPSPTAPWRARARELALSVETEVALRLGEIRLPLTALVRLGPGDILPIARPRVLKLVSGDTVVGTLPAAALRGPGGARDAASGADAS